AEAPPPARTSALTAGALISALSVGGGAPSGPAGRRPRGRRCLGEADLLAEVDVLNRVQDLHALLHGLLEGLAARDEPGATGALVDDGGERRVGDVVLARGAARVD